MKKIALMMVLLVFVGSIAIGQTTQVLSRNAVGYVKILGEKGKLTLGRSDFEAMDSAGGIQVSNMFGEQLPADTFLYLWDRSAATYKILAKASRGSWGAAGTTRVARGGGFWIRVPGTAASNEYPVYIMGEVPDRSTSPTTTVSGITGVNMFGFPYPVQGSWTNTDIAKKAPPNSFLYIWNQAGQAYVVYAKSARGAWDAATTNLVLNPGQGFWLRNTGTFDWVEAKPYTWP
jgi:hypothetical protein